VEATAQRAYFMSAKEALGYGMIDKIMERATQNDQIVDPVRRSHVQEGGEKRASGTRSVGKTRRGKSCVGAR
jgi:hypothetical protein